MNKWYTHNPEIRPGEWMRKVLWDSQIQTDHVISARRLDQVTVNNNNKKKKKKEKRKENLTNRGLCCPGRPQKSWKKLKRKISIWTLPENWKNCGTWNWLWYELWLELLVQSTNGWYKDWKTWIWDNKWRP